MRDNLKYHFLKDKILGVASSCDLQYVVDDLKELNVFKEIHYNFELGTSDDVSIELRLENSFLHNCDFAIVSISESTKKLIHPIISAKADIDYNLIFENIKNELYYSFQMLEKSNRLLA
jgi:hypothetical protein